MWEATLKWLIYVNKIKGRQRLGCHVFPAFTAELLEFPPTKLTIEFRIGRTLSHNFVKIVIKFSEVIGAMGFPLHLH